MKRIMCLVGESGSGKSTIAEALERSGFKQVQSYTTRPKRSENEQGHIFVTQEDFDALRGDLVAYTRFGDYEYGATRQQVEECDIYVIDPLGVMYLSECIGRENMIVVFVKASYTERRNRLIKSVGKERAYERILRDTRAFKDFDDYDIAFKNESKEQLNMNILILSKVLQKTKESREI